MNNRIIDPNTIPNCAWATAEQCSLRIYDIKATGEAISEAWKKGEVSNIDWVIQRLVEMAQMNENTLGSARLEC